VSVGAGAFRRKISGGDGQLVDEEIPFHLRYQRGRD